MSASPISRYLSRMSKTIIVNGYGPGISSAVAERFGKEGFSVAIVARNSERLAEGVKSLTAKGIRAEAFTANLGDPSAAREVVSKARAKLGPITVVQWTAYAGVAGDVTTASSDDIRLVYDVAVTGLVAEVQAALGDLKEQKGAILVTNGGLGYFDDGIDKMGVTWGAMGLSIANSAKHKLVRMLSHKLKDDGIYVGEVVVTGSVKGTVFDNGSATLEPSAIAEKFWSIYQSRSETSVRI